MDAQIALLLGQDGLVNGAVYALMALALVLVFSVTRVIFIPQGEFVAFGALSMAMMQAGKTPATLWLLVVLAVAALLVETWRWKRGATVEWTSALLWCVALPALACVLVLAWRPTGLAAQTFTTLVLITPLGPLLYRLAFRPLVNATVLTLLIVSVALHGVLV
ncbi:MAG TPA: branched-chain amino acid ABC transporter permease, partial [Rhizobacter sp.]|nr:branched-chain amino acid ABC transporter permease [Rhizobacter sp.]